MKALVLSDLHLQTIVFTDIFRFEKTKRILQNQINGEYDVVLISGDIFESSIYRHDVNDILNKLYQLFEKDVIFFLGNHEFAYKNIDYVLDYWKNGKHDHVFCLDVLNKVEISGITFVGNIFWYDFTLNKNRTLMQGEVVDGWLDSTIDNFDPIEENKKCKQQILNSLSKENINVLITHTVPHIDLNMFSIDMPTSLYNAYSGCENFLSELNNFNVKYAICGHTHRRVCKEIYGINCINIGNDYFFKTNKIEYMIIDI